MCVVREGALSGKKALGWERWHQRRQVPDGEPPVGVSGKATTSPDLSFLVQGDEP